MRNFKITIATEPDVVLEKRKKFWNSHFKCYILSFVHDDMKYKRQNNAFKMAIPNLVLVFQSN